MSTFPRTTYWKVLNDGEEFRFGGFIVQDDTQLQDIYMMIYRYGSCEITERLRINVYFDASMTKLKASSAWSYLKDITGGTTNLRGRLLFTFAPKVWLNNDSTYHFSVEIDGHTRNGDLSYVACMYDWPLQVNDNANALQAEIYGYRKVAYQ